MPLDESSIYFFIVIFGGAFTQGFTGFGFSLICLPILFLIYDPKLIIFLTLLPGCFTAIVNFLFYKKTVPWKEISYFSFWLILGLLLGGFAFQWIPVVLIKLMLWLMLCYSLASRTVIGHNKFLSHPVFCGISAGIAQGTIGAPGPAAVSYAFSQPWDEEKKRSAIVAILCFSCLIRLGIYLQYPEMHDSNLWIIGVLCVPVIFSGSYIGQWIGKSLPETAIKRSVDVFLAVFILTMGYEIIKSLL